MACSNNTSSCGCTHTHSAECIYYKGTSYSCIPVTKGMDMEEVIGNIADYICNEIDPPSGNVYIVASCDGNITVSSEVDGNTTTYTVCLDGDIITNIENNTANIATLTTCVANGVLDLTTNTPEYVTLTEVSSEDCGRIIAIDVNPSGTPTLDGIVYNDTTAATLPNGSGGDQIVKSFTWDYISNNNLSDKDEIHFDVRGKTQGDGSQSDGIKISIFDVNSATEVFVVNPAYVDLNTSNTGLASYTIHGEITATDVANGDAIITITLLSNLVDNGVNGSARTSYSEICDDISGVDFSNLRIRVIQTNVTGFTAAEDNACRQLKVEVKKYIGA